MLVKQLLFEKKIQCLTLLQQDGLADAATIKLYVELATDDAVSEEDYFC